jgi:hypothetical protein
LKPCVYFFGVRHDREPNLLAAFILNRLVASAKAGLEGGAGGTGVPWYATFHVSMFYMVVLTIMLSPVLVYLYCRAVTRLMSLSSGEKEAVESSQGADQFHNPPHSPLPASAAARSGADAPPAPVLQGAVLMERMAQRRTRVAVAYGVAGACHAAVLTTIFATRYWGILSKNAPSGVLLIGLIAFMFCLPVLLTLLHLLSASRLRQSLVVVVVIGATYLLAGAFDKFAGDFFVLHLLIPLMLFLVLNLRFWRGVAPLTMVIMMPIGLGAVLAVSGWVAMGGAVDHVWIGRLAGAALGALLGYIVLVALASAHEAGKTGDQEIFLDSWWLLFTVYQTGVWSTKEPIYLLTMTSFLVYLVVKRMLLRWLVPPAPEAATPNLLLLRVFGFDRRAEQLFDQLTLPWRLVGSVSLIMGPDIAMRSIAPPDFAAFVVGQLRRRFTRDASALARAIRSGQAKPTPDGRFPVRQLLCMANTWEPVMRALGAASHAVVMDLRGFTGDRQGCRVELEYLAATAPSKPVILLVDKATDTLLIRQIIDASRTDPQQGLPANWQLVEAMSNTRQAAQRAMAHLAEQLGERLP